MMKKVLILGMILALATHVWAAQTLLLTQAQVVGSAVNAGDTFHVNVSVTNVGSVPAVNTRGDLRNTPYSWSVTPFTNGGPAHVYGSQNFGTLAPGQTAYVQYTVTRDATEAGPILPSKGLWFRVFANNAPVAESNGIEVPIHPIVGGLLIASIAGGAFLVSRKK